MNYARYFLAYLLGGVVMGAMIYLFLPSYVTIKKSSDSEWELSREKFPDTTITETKVINGITVHPTVQYLNVKMK